MLHHLKDYNPDKTQFLLDGYPAGFFAGMCRVDPAAGECKKSPCALALAMIDDFISTERAMGRIIGHFG